jgi:hypothetical protein
MPDSRVHSRRCTRLGFVLCAALLLSVNSAAETVRVRHAEGLVHGFLVLHSLEGGHLADGDLVQTARGDRVTTQLVFHFKDGSLHDETATYSQRGSFRLLQYRLVQKGPAFKTELDVSMDATSGQITIRHSAGENKTAESKESVFSQRAKLPPDITNGIVFTLLKNIPPETPQTTVSMMAATPKPRVVKLHIVPQGEEPFTTGTAQRRAVHYVVKVELGGIAKLVAPLLGKEPPDTHVWILQGQAPAFVKSEGPLYFGGPIWRLELTSPAWPTTPVLEKKE